jgi:hypothetical protein
VKKNVAHDALRHQSRPRTGLSTGLRLSQPHRGASPFFNGAVVRELFVDIGNEAPRLACAVVDDAYTHHHASAQVFADGEDRSRFVRIADFLSRGLATRTRKFMGEGRLSSRRRWSARRRRLAGRTSSLSGSLRPRDSLAARIGVEGATCSLGGGT